MAKRKDQARASSGKSLKPYDFPLNQGPLKSLAPEPISFSRW